MSALYPWDKEVMLFIDNVGDVDGTRQICHIRCETIDLLQTSVLR